MKNQPTSWAQPKQGGRDSRSGSALVIVLLLAVILAGLGAALASTAKASSDVVRSSINEDRALLLAESAMAAATSRWARDEDPVLGQEAAPIKEGAGSYWVTSSQLDPDTVSLIVTAQVDRSTSVIEVVMKKSSAATPLFGEHGVFAREWVEWSDNGTIDSYDPAIGYNNMSPAERSMASMRSNDSIYLTGGTTMHGDVTLNGTATTDDGATVTGAIVQATEYYTPPPLPPVPSFPSEGTWLAFSSTRTIESGDHAYDSMEFNGDSVTTIIGPATITTGDFLLDQDSRVVVDATDGPVVFHIRGRFFIKNGTHFVTSDHDPESLQFFISTENGTTGEKVTFQGGGVLEGFVFAPNSDVVVNNGTNVFGALVANRLSMRGGAQLHQDVSLSTFSLSEDGATGTPELLMWRTLSPIQRDALLASRN